MKIYIVKEFEIEMLVEGKDFKKSDLFIRYNGRKIYLTQFEELIVVDGEVVAVTDCVELVEKLQEKIRNFLDKYPEPKVWY